MVRAQRLAVIDDSNTLLPDGKEARMKAKEAKVIMQQTANGVDEIKCA